MTDNETQYRVPHLDLNGEPIEWLEDFGALIDQGVIPTETTGDIATDNMAPRRHRLPGTAGAC